MSILLIKDLTKAKKPGKYDLIRENMAKLGIKCPNYGKYSKVIYIYFFVVRWSEG